MKRSAIYCFIVALLPSVSCGVFRAREVQESRGEPFEDSDLVGMLRPEVPMASEGLFYAPARRLYYYEAELRDVPGGGFVKAYVEALGKRGVLIQAFGTSPHLPIPLRAGWEFAFYRPGRQKPFSLRCTAFMNRDDEAIERNWWNNAPEPWSLDGKRLRVELGRRDEAWTEHILVPTEDVVKDLKEFPFGRLPGALVKDAFDGVDSDSSMLDGRQIARLYAATGSSEGVLYGHYERALRAFGFQVDVGKDGLWTRGSGVEGLRSVGVAVVRFAMPCHSFEGDPQQAWPHLFEGYPSDTIYFRVNVNFVDNNRAAPYFPSKNRARREALRKGRTDAAGEVR